MDTWPIFAAFLLPVAFMAGLIRQYLRDIDGTE
jgi:hypothetical protein